VKTRVRDGRPCYFSKYKKEIKIHNEINTSKNPYELATLCDAIVLMTPWKEFETLNFQRIKNSMKTPYFLDPQNVLVSKNLPLYGFYYIGLGRGGNR